MNLEKMKKVFESLFYGDDILKTYYGITLDNDKNILIFYENLERDATENEIKNAVNEMIIKLKKEINYLNDSENNAIFIQALKNLEEYNEKISNNESLHGNLYLNVFNVKEDFYNSFDNSYRTLLEKEGFNIEKIAKLMEEELSRNGNGIYNVTVKNERTVTVKDRLGIPVILIYEFGLDNEYEIFSKIATALN